VADDGIQANDFGGAPSSGVDFERPAIRRSWCWTKDRIGATGGLINHLADDCLTIGALAERKLKGNRMSSDKRPLSVPELIDLFKHWDTRVSHQELLFVPLAAAALPAVAAGGDHLSASILLVVALGSLGVYLYHLFAIRRIAVFQDQIFAKLSKDHLTDWHDIANDPMKRLGVRRLRPAGFMVLAILWIVMLLEKLQWAPTCLWLGIIGILFFVSLAIVLWQWRETTPQN